MTITPYRALEQRFRRINAVEEAADLLSWDQATMMPEGGRAARAEELAALRLHAHELLTASETGELLAGAEENGLFDWDAANLHEMGRKHAHATALPADLVDAMSRASIACEAAWRQARRDDDFGVVAPALQDVVMLARRAAEAKSERLGVPPYEALMDQFEPGARAEQIDRIFADYVEFLPDFLARVVERQNAEPAPVVPSGPFLIVAQKELARHLAQQLGFTFDRGRLDESPHPFSTGRAGDVRITTRYRESEAMQAIMAVIHETGHALYEQQLPPEWRFQPVGQSRGMTLHESQSLIYEMQAARSPAFCRFLSGLLTSTYPADRVAFAADNLYRLYTRVEPGFIRVEADEVTYPAHVVLRYRLERALIAGDLSVADLPLAWNDGMRASLGLEVRSDREGCLQDAHWYEGHFGYFPFYSLGAMTAAQLFEAASQTHLELMSEIGEGNFATLRQWLAHNVHRYASSLSTDEIVERATGGRLDIEIFKRHLSRRYLDALP